MAFDMSKIKGLLKNKWMLGGLALAAGAGGFVLYKRSKSGAANTDAASTATGVTGVGSGGTADTTGTDVATWLGSYSTGLNNTLAQYGQTLNDALKNLPSTSNPTPTP